MLERCNSRVEFLSHLSFEFTYMCKVLNVRWQPSISAVHWCIGDLNWWFDVASKSWFSHLRDWTFRWDYLLTLLGRRAAGCIWQINPIHPNSVQSVWENITRLFHFSMARTPKPHLQNAKWSQSWPPCKIAEIDRELSCFFYFVRTFRNPYS